MQQGNHLVLADRNAKKAFVLSRSSPGEKCRKIPLIHDEPTVIFVLLLDCKHKDDLNAGEQTGTH